MKPPAPKTRPGCMLCLLFCFLQSYALQTPHSLADDRAAQARSENAESLDSAQIDKWVRNLGAKQLAKRQTARAELVKAGATAVPALLVAAGSEDTDLQERAISVLGVLLDSEDPDTKESALSALKILADSDNPQAADLAQRVLNASRIPGVAMPEKQAITNHSVSISVVNGNTTIRVSEDEKEITIKDDGNIISMEIQEGKVRKTVTAKSEEELKRKDKEAWRLYKKYTSKIKRPSGGMQSNAFDLRFSDDVRVAGSSFSFSSTLLIDGKAVEQKNAAEGENQSVKQLIEQLRQLKNRLPKNEQLQRLIDQQIRQLQQSASPQKPKPNNQSQQ